MCVRTSPRNFIINMYGIQPKKKSPQKLPRFYFRPFYLYTRNDRIWNWTNSNLAAMRENFVRIKNECWYFWAKLSQVDIVLLFRFWTLFFFRYTFDDHRCVGGPASLFHFRTPKKLCVTWVSMMCIHVSVKWHRKKLSTHLSVRPIKNALTHNCSAA